MIQTEAERRRREAGVIQWTLRAAPARARFGPQGLFWLENGHFSSKAAILREKHEVSPSSRSPLALRRPRSRWPLLEQTLGPLLHAYVLTSSCRLTRKPYENFYNIDILALDTTTFADKNVVTTAVG